jgi:hypothetical protein
VPPLRSKRANAARASAQATTDVASASDLEAYARSARDPSSETYSLTSAEVSR